MQKDRNLLVPLKHKMWGDGSKLYVSARAKNLSGLSVLSSLSYASIDVLTSSPSTEIGIFHATRTMPDADLEAHSKVEMNTLPPSVPI